MGENNNSIENVEFIPGNQLEIYFPEEKVEYRFTISSKNIIDEDCVAVTLPREFKNTFYKGEDFLQCRYVLRNVVYEFGGEIKRIIYGDDSYIVIKRSSTPKKSTHRIRKKLVTTIVCEYFVQKVMPGEPLSRHRGFVSIKDVSEGGISFLTTDNLPTGTILIVSLNNENVKMTIEIKSFQKVNQKNFYGAKLLSFEGDGKVRYEKLLKRLSDEHDDDTFVGEIY